MEKDVYHVIYQTIGTMIQIVVKAAQNSNIIILKENNANSVHNKHLYYKIINASLAHNKASLFNNQEIVLAILNIAHKHLYIHNNKRNVYVLKIIHLMMDKDAMLVISLIIGTMMTTNVNDAHNSNIITLILENVNIVHPNHLYLIKME